MKEEWRDIKGYERLYQVSNFGRIKSLKRKIAYKDGRGYTKNDKIINGSLAETGGGYLWVRLFKNKIGCNFYIHRLVAITFIPNFSNKPEVNHINCNTRNNFANNLEWCTKTENMKHASNMMVFPLGENHHHSKLNEFQVRVIRKTNGLSQRELAKFFNISQTSIADILKQRTWRHTA